MKLLRELLHEAKLDAKNLDKLAQAVWAAPDADHKREQLSKMVDSFKFKEKQDMFRRKIANEKNPTKLDKLAADITLALSDKVIK